MRERANLVPTLTNTQSTDATVRNHVTTAATGPWFVGLSKVPRLIENMNGAGRVRYRKFGFESEIERIFRVSVRTVGSDTAYKLRPSS